MKITAYDFDQLTTNSMQWGDHWEEQIGRFDPKPFLSWDFAYWCDTYLEAKFATEYLGAIGEKFQLTHDDGLGEWVIVTDYKSNAWKE